MGIKTVADGALFAAAGIPTVYHGPVGDGRARRRRVHVGPGARAGASVYVALLKRLLV